MAQPATARGVRERVRTQMTAEILAVARAQLSSAGADGLSLRAISRELGMASSAIYRYFPSRDALLTQLIIDAYNAVGEAAEIAESDVPRSDLKGRFLATATSVRSWALANRHEYALIFGSPVPGYAAPQDTIAPATRVAVVLIGILMEAAASARVRELPTLPHDVEASMEPLLNSIREIVSSPAPSGGSGSETDLPTSLIARGLIAWTHLIGAINFELFGHRHNVIGSSEAAKRSFFDYEMSTMIDLTGIE